MPAHADPVTTAVNCPTDDLAAAIGASHFGDTLVISGTCVGNFAVGKKLTLSGSPGAVLDGGGAGTTLTTSSIKKTVVQDLMITGGADSVAGAGINNSGGLILRSTIVTGNGTDDTPGAQGGGIFNSGTLTLFGSSVRGNFVFPTQQGDNTQGGGIYNTGTLSMWGSAVNDNSAYSDGGIFNSGTLNIFGSTVSRNRDDVDTGGIDNVGTMTLTRSTISNNSGGGGGGLFNAGSAVIDNSTVSDNFGQFVGAIGNHGTLILRHSTVSGNVSGWFEVFPGGIWGPDGTVVVDSSIVAGNTGSDAQDCTGTITSNGYNLIGDADGCDFVAATGDQVGSGTGSGAIDPMLGPLASNGGKTQTQSLLPGSPALNAIPVGTVGADGVSALCPASGTRDQRFIVRPQGAACDIGAFERKAHP
jgi:hypothetical protein